MNGSGWTYNLSPRAARDMERLDVSVRERVFDALDRFVQSPSRIGGRKLRGREEEWRLRVGSWRVLYERDVTNRVIVVLRVLPRGRAYRD